MAMVLDAFAGKCLSLLEQLIEEKVVTILGVKDDIQRLREKLEMIKDVLHEAERRRIEDAATNRWLSKLWDVMYDADDMIDLCRIKGCQLLQEGESRPPTYSSPGCCRFPFLSCFITTVTSIPLRHEIGEQIQKLSQRLEDIYKDRQMFSLPHSGRPNGVATQVKPPQTSALAKSIVVGTQTKLHVKRLVDSLVKIDNNNLLLIAITGLGGIGKITLAQKIYNHQKVHAHFQKKIWVCVSQNFSETELLKQIIRSAGGDYGRAETKAELQPLLTSTLEGNRFLLVLDDVWRADDLWKDLLQTPLEQADMSACGILITTINEDVAKGMQATQIHKVEKLSINDGWELLYKRVFKDVINEDIPNLHEIGMQIVEKCDGLPLAIEAVAGVLRTKDKSKREWENVYNEVKNPECLRTLHLIKCLEINLIDLFQRFTRLRVLDLSGSRIESIPESIQNLCHLRYLDLDRTTIHVLPDSIGCLSNLQFLNLQGCESLHTLPEAITQLHNLRRLGIFGTPVSHVPVGIGKLEHLNDLQGFVVGSRQHQQPFPSLKSCLCIQCLTWRNG